MSFFKQSLLRDALGAPAMESAEVVTEEVGSSASAQVEIERLKQENLDIMEIHALEQDVALIEKQGEGVEELSYALDEVGELKASMESYLEKGGMTAADAAGINRSLRFLNRRLGGALNINMPATESFVGATADRVTLTVAMEGGIGEFFKKIWDGIVNFFKKIINTIKGWFGKSEKKADEAKKELEGALNSLPGDGEFDASVFSNPSDYIGKTAHSKLAKNFEGKDLIDVIASQATTTKDVLVTAKSSMEKIRDLSVTSAVNLTKEITANTTYNLKNECEELFKQAKSFIGKSTKVKDTGSEDIVEAYNSQILVYGKQLSVHKMKADDDGIFETKIVVSDDGGVKKDGVEKDLSEIVVKPGSKVNFKTYKDAGKQVLDTITETIIMMEVISASSDKIGELLNKDPTFGDKVNDKTKDGAKKSLDVFRNFSKMILTNPATSICTDAINIAVRLANTSKKISAEK